LESFRSDSLSQEEDGDEVHLLGVLTRCEEYWSSGATSAMAAVVLGDFQEKRKTERMERKIGGGELRGEARVSSLGCSGFIKSGVMHGSRPIELLDDDVAPF
jgi:hypothetical protein